ncbi:nuclear transport factor 2 family protein [Aliiglaciecola sp. CAU 1673]|uniref:nuclear transport factor 2 family protein n=1 Tax=Aliiglaciecola sp. CAU 1673 TaxID=3032595 RepID=UPI0023D9A96D|nr:nuclear transport factor 2 family protein [Aliiglaciecola sp. CAU 1673]MDF2180262.1 nuclear transport factor 2 family protein [Aliiglaciecola sp. CAU 1673]
MRIKLIVVTNCLLLNYPVLADALEQDKKILRHMKEVLWPQAYREQDVDLLDKILAANFVMIDSQGNWTDKAIELADLPSYAWPHEQFHYEIKRLEIFGDDSAIVAGEGRAKGQGKEGPYCLRYQSTNVLYKEHHQWRAVSSHVSGVQTACTD